MTVSTEDTPLSADPVVNDLLERGIEQAESGHPPRNRQALSDLARDYFLHVDPADLIESDPSDLIGMVTSHRRLARVRQPGETKVSVFTPTVNANGWTCGHTVVQVVTDDMPFVVDSICLALTGSGHDLHLIIHPQMVVVRDESGELTDIVGQLALEGQDEWPAGAQVESWVLVEINRESAQPDLDAVDEAVTRALTDVRASVEDWKVMHERAVELAAELRTHPPATVPATDVAEAAEFIDWLADNNFTFLGYREYDLLDGGETLAPIAGTSLGIMREAPALSLSFSKLPAEVRRKASEPRVLVLTKANSRSTVHRSTYLDYVGVKRFDADGAVTGERRFLGLYTGAAYAQSVHHIPVLRQLEQDVLERAGVDPSSHRGKDLLHFIETYPRDDLFQVTSDYLYETGMSVLGMQERRMVRVYVREDAYGRFFSVLVYLPRDRYTTTVRLSIQSILMEMLHGVNVDYMTSVSESLLARLAFIIRVDPTESMVDVDLEALQTRVRAAVRSWDDDFADALVSEVGEEQAATMRSYAAGFPDAYREVYSPRGAVADVRTWESLPDEDGLAVSLYEPLDPEAGERRFKVFRTGTPVTLLEVLPILASLDVQVVDEHPFAVPRPGRSTAYVYDFGLNLRKFDSIPDVESLPQRFSDSFVAAFTGEREPDLTLGLVTRTGLTWRQSTYVQAWVHYARQIGSPFSYRSFAETLIGHPDIVTLLIELFETRHDPDRNVDRVGHALALDEAISAQLDQVASLDNDRILRQIIGIVSAILRTNAFQVHKDGSLKRWLSFKLDPRAIAGMPEPRPKYEIFVFSPDTSGVHLRFGDVARGGLRWSDRRDDFRTEVLGLVKAQEVKNAVIVPVGSKGGFVVKNPIDGGTREELLAQGKMCYTQFISGLLDITDNRVQGEVVPPPRTVRWDGDDPYLVVAADKGTATFSDLANSISAHYGFWLGDAFASGGSEGYDHKAMGITARGAWESVKRHFRELGVNVQTEPFTVVGVGDMSGDVFGNGMLLSEQIKLVAAFDHRHIFLDPDPDPAVSFAERARMFALPRSSWADYDTSLISPGGGVYARTEKSVPISARMREVLGLADGIKRLSPPELLRAILLAPVDLLWNGGIGTYVKASSETDLDVGDKANDAIRVDGRDLRVRVVGEGGNLGLTQRGRIEAARNGVLLNTDAVDNSAGVDCSDHEVNIKIALDSVVAAGDLTLKQRNALLASMTDEVAELVLRDNYEQNVLLGNARAQDILMLPVHMRLMRWLESAGDLDRALEYLPSDDAIEELRAAGLGLTSPEFCTLMAYAKISLTSGLNASDVDQDPYYSRLLESYFPEPMRAQHMAVLEAHPLRKQIVSTMLANGIINRGGITFVFRAYEETGASAPEVARAFSVARAVFDLDRYWADVAALDNLAPTVAQAQLNLEIRRLLDRATRWFLTTRGGRLDVAKEIDRFAAPVQALMPRVPELLVGIEAERLADRTQDFVDLGAPEDLANSVASLLDVFSLLDIVQVASRHQADAETVARIYFALSERFGIDRLLAAITQLPRSDRWDALARSSLRSDLYGAIAGLTARVMRVAPEGTDPFERIALWEASNTEGQARARSTLTEIAESSTPTLATISVALRVIRTLVYQGSADE